MTLRPTCLALALAAAIAPWPSFVQEQSVNVYWAVTALVTSCCTAASPKPPASKLTTPSTVAVKIWSTPQSGCTACRHPTGSSRPTTITAPGTAQPMPAMCCNVWVGRHAELRAVKANANANPTANKAAIAPSFKLLTVHCPKLAQDGDVFSDCQPLINRDTA